MTIAYMCIVITVFIPIICAAYSKITGKNYDNTLPREFLDKLEGKAKRAHYAQLNGYEVFPPFAAAVIIAHQLHAPQHLLNNLAMGFVGARILYCLFYISNVPNLRTLVWFLGLFITIAIFFIGVK